MTERIKGHIDNLLKDAPRTRRVVDLQEELLNGCLEKYADLTASGMSENEAYNAVIAGIGDVNELTGGVRRSGNNQKLIGPVSSSLWPLVTLIFLWLGFWRDLWHPGWLVFVGGALLQLLITAALSGPGRRGAPLTGALYVAATLVFLVFGFWTDAWPIATLVFVFAVAVQQILRLVRVWRDDS